MTIEPKLAAECQKYAEFLDKNDKFEHSVRDHRMRGAGENLAWHSDPKIAQNSTHCTDDWYNEI